MFSVLVAIVIITSSTKSCPPKCFCWRKSSFVNCANSDRTVIPKALPKRYRTLNLAYNKIVMITSEDIKNLKSFELVDLRNNPLNCSVNFFRRVNTTFLKRCSPSTTHGQASTPQTSPKPSKNTTLTSPKAEPSDAKGSYAKSEKKYWIWVISAVLGLILTTAAIMARYFCCARNERVVTLESIELNALTHIDASEASSDEETVFVKNKQL